MAGSAYTYSQQSFGTTVGFLTGWLLMLDYLFIPMINFMVVGLYLGTQFPAVPDQVFMLGAILTVLIFNLLGITLVSRINLIGVSVQLAAVVVFVILAAKMAANDPTAPGFMDPFLPGAENFSPVLTGAAVLALSFLGFDAVSTLSEEAKSPRRHIPLAIMMTTLIGGVTFMIVAWVGARAYYLDDWADASEELLDAPGVVLFGHVGGQALVILFLFVVLIGAFSSGLAGQVAVSRILYAMGRDRILPRPFAFIWKRYGTPAFATIVVSILALSSLFLSLDQAAFMISFGALSAFAVVNLSVIRLFIFPKGLPAQLQAKNIVRHGIIPFAGFVATVWLWTSLEKFTWVVGGVWAAIGLVILLINTKFFTKPVPKLELDELSTETIDLLQENHSLKHGGHK